MGIGVAAALAAASIFAVSRFDSNSLEYDFNKLRRADTWVNGEGYWGRKKDAPAAIPEKGPIELQHHGDHLEFKNIYIKEL